MLRKAHRQAVRYSRYPTFFFEIPVLTAAPKEVAGAMLDKPVNAAQIETGPKGVPAIVAESSKVKA